MCFAVVPEEMIAKPPPFTHTLNLYRRRWINLFCSVQSCLFIPLLSCSTLCLKSHSGIYPLGDVVLQSICRTGRGKREREREKKKRREKLRHTLRGNRQKWGAACDWYCVHFKYWCQRFSLSLHVSLLCSRWRLSPPQNGCQPCTMSGVMTGEEAFPDGWGRVIKPEAVETNTRRCCGIGCVFFFLLRKKQFKRV